MADRQNTTFGPNTSWGLGTANSARNGFPQTDSNIPPASDLWKNYFKNTMRGSTDGPWYDGDNQGRADLGGTVLENSTSRTFLASTSTTPAPPIINDLRINGVNVSSIGKGEPDGGFVPTVASPGEGNGANPFNIPALNGDLTEKLMDNGAGLSLRGSIRDPYGGAGCQVNQDANQIGQESPVYSNAGMYAWSDLFSPRPA